MVPERAAHFRIVQKRMERDIVYIMNVSDRNRAIGGVYKGSCNVRLRSP